MSIGVTLFNACSTALSVTLNQGNQMALAATSAEYDWAPYPQDSTPVPTFTRGNPAPNVIGCGSPNSLSAFVNGVPEGGPPFQFTIPTEYPLTSIQIYVFFKSVQQCSWVALADGKIIAQLYAYSR